MSETVDELIDRLEGIVYHLAEQLPYDRFAAVVREALEKAIDDVEAERDLP
jgi:predicted DNA-binding protein